MAYFDIGKKEIGDLLRKNLGNLDLIPNSWIHAFSHATDDSEPWDLIYGTSFGFSSIGVPGKLPGPDSTVKILSDLVDRKVQSKSNMDVLSGYGVNMDHPCVRVFTKEEVDANRKFLVASGQNFALHRFIRVRFVTQV